MYPKCNYLQIFCYRWADTGKWGQRCPVILSGRTTRSAPRKDCRKPVNLSVSLTLDSSPYKGSQGAMHKGGVDPAPHLTTGAKSIMIHVGNRRKPSPSRWRFFCFRFLNSKSTSKSNITGGRGPFRATPGKEHHHETCKWNRQHRASAGPAAQAVGRAGLGPRRIGPRGAAAGQLSRAGRRRPERTGGIQPGAPCIGVRRRHDGGAGHGGHPPERL